MKNIKSRLNQKPIDRRDFLKLMGAGTGSAILAGCTRPEADNKHDSNNGITGEMTYRTNSSTGDKVSLLGYGCMRLPTSSNESARDSDIQIDQEAVNHSVDYALEHGVNYFDTSPAYCKGASEHAMGIALSRHPRDSYFIATKLSNFAPQTWSRERSIEMYRNSLRELQTDYIDYMLLHGIGMDGMEAYNGRYEDNGIRKFLEDERAAGHIRNLGFSYHGDIKVFDHLLALHDSGEAHWDFVQIQLNYVDWLHAKEINPRNTNAKYLYNELDKRGISVVIMEPLLGGRLASIADGLAAQMKERRPDDSIASWAFRYAGSPERVLTVLSGMTYMEHLQDNLHTYSPLDPVTDDELAFLNRITTLMLEYPTVPCTDCKYCMPCPYGLDIPAIFAHYNKCLNEGRVATDSRDPKYAKARREFLIGYDRSVPKLRQASHCINCGACLSHCPQGIQIPNQLSRIDRYVEQLKQTPS